MDFTGKVVLITGASSGIGASCALHFANLSAELALVGRNVENLKSVADQCEQASGIKPLIIIADISVEENIARIINETINKYGRLDVLVNNAGITRMAGVMDDITNFDLLTATNIRGPYLLSQQAIPHLIETKGNIVNVSSIVSTVPIPTMTPYCMTKAALDMFMKCAALELACKGVRVNSVNPGPVETELFKRAGFDEESNKGLYSGMAASMPLKKCAFSEDVAKMVVFLASDHASCITGSRHEVDCGLHLGAPPSFDGK
ncbi:3-oxoacyl-[acyl-carrier-protein] reductase FabG-like [Maniola jurtina]|uniref:3-oxoacyl-[acyl-carrier-protein] reductase FabG-like n=1 Tax=Maniola jurtina TaxID=191418 RepID=UPI001E68DDA5|nr:3-oxoacyl-[acyl-carrier-protein] reductase FabG-like [Maniola jurtina]